MSWRMRNYADGCDNCHGGFTANPYDPPSGGTNWSNSLHNIHQGMVSSDCNICHTGTPEIMVTHSHPFLLESSTGGAGLAAISCVGCHGRDRRHGPDHCVWNLPNEARACVSTTRAFANCGGCHSDQTGYTPVGENILPNYYANPGTGHPNIPSSACNGENFAGSATGLDNDGNGLYDVADPNCPVPVELMIFEIE